MKIEGKFGGTFHGAVCDENGVLVRGVFVPAEQSVFEAGRAAGLREAAEFIRNYDPAFSATNGMLDDIATAILVHAVEK